MNAQSASLLAIAAASPATGRDWWSLAELAELALPGLPADERSLRRRARDDRWDARIAPDGTPLARRRAGRGGGAEYHASVLPGSAQLELAARGLSATRPVPAEALPRAAAEWQWFDRQSAKVKDEAAKRAAIVAEIDVLEAAGITRSAAVNEAARNHSIGASTMWNWLKSVAGVAPQDRLPFLAPRRKGGGAEAEIPDDLWRVFLSDYLRPEQPTLSSCYDRVGLIAAARGFSLPSEAAFRRRLKRDVDARVVLFRRGKKDEFNRSVPDNRRTLHALHALEIVNIDGHQFDVRCLPPGVTERDPKGRNEVRPVLIAIQDIMSRKVLAWRMDLSENVIATRLAFGDLFQQYGIPKQCLLDNSRTFASKALTAGAETRYRGKHNAEEPAGLLTSLGIRVRFAQVYHGQSKPIERAFRDMADRISRGPECAGAYVGNSVANKPANYGERALLWDEFEAIVARGIAHHNARTGRRGGVCAGRSFDQVFAESYAVAPIGKATPEQLRIALLAAEQKRVNSRTGEIELYGNRYWSAECGLLRGQRVTVRFDPEDLSRDVHIYALSGEYLTAAQIIDDTGFADQAGAHAAKKRRQEYRRLVKQAEEAEDLLTAAQIAAMMPDAATPDLPAPGAVRMVKHRTNVVPKAAAKPAPVATISEQERRNFDGLGKALRLVD